MPSASDAVLGATQQVVCNRAGDSRAWGSRCDRQLLRTRAGAVESSRRRAAGTSELRTQPSFTDGRKFTDSRLARIRY